MNELISHILQWMAVMSDQQKHIHQLYVDIGCQDVPRTMEDCDGWREKVKGSVLFVLHNDDDDDDSSNDHDTDCKLWLQIKFTSFKF